jgi:hypothetical protein
MISTSDPNPSRHSAMRATEALSMTGTTAHGSAIVVTESTVPSGAIARIDAE